MSDDTIWSLLVYSVALNLVIPFLGMLLPKKLRNTVLALWGINFLAGVVLLIFAGKSNFLVL